MTENAEIFIFNDLYNLRLLTPLEKVIAGLESGKLGASLEVKHFPGKGRGVVTLESIPCGDTVTEYKSKEVYKCAKKSFHVNEYDRNNEGSYILEIQTPEGWVCLDATRRMGSIGWLMNHSSNPNLKPFRALFVRGKWRVGFLAITDIGVGEELTWNYGSPPQGHQWLYKKPPQYCSPHEKYANEILWACSVLICYFFSTQQLVINQLSSSTSHTLKVLHTRNIRIVRISIKGHIVSPWLS